MGSCHVSLFYAILRKNSAFIYIYDKGNDREERLYDLECIDFKRSMVKRISPNLGRFTSVGLQVGGWKFQPDQVDAFFN